MATPDVQSLKYDPFLTRIGEPGQPGDAVPGTADSLEETQPLLTDPVAPARPGGEAKLMILPTACCMMTQTIVSVVALAVSFSETGHKDGYDEGHLDSDNGGSGCEAMFYWLMVQAGLDLTITCLTCLFLVSPLKTEPVGVHGCAATVRLCTLAAGFYILYFSGLRRDSCNQFMIIWATILVWAGAVAMAFGCCILTVLLLGFTNASHPQYRQPRGRGAVKTKAPSMAYRTTFGQS